MLMKPSVPGPNRKTVSRTAARNAALINQFATPGLGSLMTGRWIAGTGQLLVFLAGCGMHAYGQATGEFEPEPNQRLGEIGLILFVGAWLWALVTSISLMLRAKSEEPAVLSGSSPPVSPPAVPPKLTE